MNPNQIHEEISGLLANSKSVPLRRQKWIYEPYIEITAAILQTCCLCGSVIVLVGYLIGVETLYRPLANGAATHPLTALSIAFLTLSTILYSSKKYLRLLNTCITLSLISPLLRLSEVLLAQELTPHTYPFYDTVSKELGEGKQNAMGLNTALTLLLVASSLILSKMKKYYFAQFQSFSALIFPVISLTGYLYQIEPFFGEMSLITSVLCVCLCLGIFCLNPRKGVMRALLANSVTGSLVRIQIAVGILVPLSLGYLLTTQLTGINDHYYIAMFVVSSSWFVICMFVISAAFHERFEHAHYLSESRLRHAATHDSLTHLPNRRKFFENAQQELLRARRTGKELWLLMIDVDRFKQVNDRAGHQTGDEVLKKVANILRNTVRVTDSVCRFGGEEFAALLPDADLEGAVRVANGIRAAMESSDFDGYSDKYGPITVSIGMEKANIHEDLNSLISRTDNSLYSAKEARNSVFSMSLQKAC